MKMLVNGNFVRYFLFAFWMATAITMAPSLQAATLESINARITNFRLFEGPHPNDGLSDDQRSYARAFEISSSRFVYFELNTSHPSPGRIVEIPLTMKIFRSDNTLYVEHAINFTVQSSWTRTTLSYGTGWRTSGNWPSGSYTLKVFQGTRELASGGFRILTNREAADRIFDWLQGIAPDLSSQTTRTSGGEYSRHYSEIQYTVKTANSRLYLVDPSNVLHNCGEVNLWLSLIAGNFADATVISGASGRVVGSNVGATKEFGEPNHAGNSGGSSVWFRWRAPVAGQVTFDTLGSNFDTTLAAYTGNSPNSLNRIASNDDVSSSVKQSRISFNATQNTTYYIAVDGYGGRSGTIKLNWSGQAVATPSAPSNIQATQDRTDAVRVTWNASSGATSYEVFRGTSTSSSSSSRITTVTGTSYNDTSAVVGTTYYYWIKAKNSAGISGFSSRATGRRVVSAPSAPSNIQATQDRTDAIRVTWNASSGATSYEVFRGTSTSSSSSSRITTVTGTSHNDTSAVVGTTYYYWIKAKNSAGTSGFSSRAAGRRVVSAASHTLTVVSNLGPGIPISSYPTGYGGYTPYTISNIPNDTSILLVPTITTIGTAVLNFMMPWTGCDETPKQRNCRVRMTDSRTVTINFRIIGQ